MRFLPRLTFIFALALGGCVSVNIPTGNNRRAEGVHFQAPANPFHDIDPQLADKAWVDEKTGNTISFISDCGNKVDPTLNQLQSEAVSVISNFKMIQEKTISFDGREALLSTVSGDVDGVAVMMRVLSLKKNSCNYTVSYTGVSKTFEQESAAFNQFMNSFKAP